MFSCIFLKKSVRCLVYVVKSVYLCTRFRKNGHNGLDYGSGSLKDLQYRQVVQEEKRRRFRRGSAASRVQLNTNRPLPFVQGEEDFDTGQPIAGSDSSGHPSPYII